MAKKTKLVEEGNAGLLAMSTNVVKFNNTFLIANDDKPFAYSDQIQDASHGYKWQSEINEDLYNKINGVTSGSSLQGEITESNYTTELDKASNQKGDFWIVNGSFTLKKGEYSTDVNTGDVVYILDPSQSEWKKRLLVNPNSGGNLSGLNVGNVWQAVYSKDGKLQAGLHGVNIADATTPTTKEQEPADAATLVLVNSKGEMSVSVAAIPTKDITLANLDNSVKGGVLIKK